MPGSPTNCAPMASSAEPTQDRFLGGRLLLRQPKSGHRAGHDAMLLAAGTAARCGDRVVEFGAGVGAAGLALTRRVGALDLVLVEIDPDLAELARENAIVNQLAAQVRVFDIGAGAETFAAVGLTPDSVDAVLMNPPFNDAARHRRSPDAQRRIAHVATATTLTGWVNAARLILKSGGALTLIWRADGIAEVMAALARGFGGIALLPIHGTADAPAIRILVRAIKGGKAPTVIHPGLVLNDGAGKPNQVAQAVLTGQDVLPTATR